MVSSLNSQRKPFGVREYLALILILLSILVCTCYFFRIWLHEGVYARVAYFFILVLLGSALLALLLRRFTLAKAVLLSGGSFFIYLFAAQEPDRPGPYLYFILASIAALMLFDLRERKKGLIFFFITFSFFLAAWSADFSLLPDHPLSHEKMMEYFMYDFLIAYAVILIVFFVFSSLHFSVESNLEQSRRSVMEKNKQLESYNDELVRHIERFEQLSYSLSHHLKGPIASLRGLYELNRMNAASFDDPYIKNSMLQLIGEVNLVANDLTLFMEIKDPTGSLERVSLQHSLQSVLSKPHIKAHSFQLKSDFNRVPFVQTYPALLESILEELIVNACRFRAAWPELSIVISSMKTNNKTLISVSDNGSGFDAHGQQKNLFKLYKKFHLNSPGRGTGLFILLSKLEWIL